jgi:hypothetical protein
LKRIAERFKKYREQERERRREKRKAGGSRGQIR